MMMDKPRRSRPVVAILGGGMTGAAVAFHLACSVSPDAVEIVVVEQREALGGGLAYSSDEPAHRINVPAARMSLVSNEPNHFMDWLARENVQMSRDTLTPRGDVFPERRIFGAYIAAHLAPLLESGAVRHRRVSAVGMSVAEGRHAIELSDGTSLIADLVVLAMTHPVPAVPSVLHAVAGSPRLVTDPYDNARVAAIAPDDRVLIVGTGLTSADVVASLGRRGHHGRITLLSRHGLRSRGHGLVREKSTIDLAETPSRTAVALVRRIRAAVAEDAARGQSWHATLDRVREQGQEIWAALPAVERRRLVRHLRTFWDVHRFRIAPQVEEALDRRLLLGQLEIVAARLVAAREADDGIVVDYRPRGGETVVSERFDAVVVTTGPDHAAVLRSNPVFRTLAGLGLLCADPNGLGLLVVDRCRTVDAAGRASETLFVAGPLARGNVGELMGLPEVTQHAEHVARVLGKRLGNFGPPHALPCSLRACPRQSSPSDGVNP